MGCPDGIDPGLVTSILQEMGMDRTMKAVEYFRDGTMGGPVQQQDSEQQEYSSRDLLLSGGGDKPAGKGGMSKEDKKEADKREANKRKELAQWFDKLNYTEKVKLHLARAFIMNAELMVFHRPLYHFNENFGRKVMALVKMHHKNRGMCMPVTTMNRRRPRTVFISVDDDWEENVADVIWRLDPKTKTISEHKPKIVGEDRFSSHLPGHKKKDNFDDAQMPSDNPIAIQEKKGFGFDKVGDWCFSPRAGAAAIPTRQPILESR